VEERHVAEALVARAVGALRRPAALAGDAHEIRHARVNRLVARDLAATVLRQFGGDASPSRAGALLVGKDALPNDNVDEGCEALGGGPDHGGLPLYRDDGQAEALARLGAEAGEEGEVHVSWRASHGQREAEGRHANAPPSRRAPEPDDAFEHVRAER